jgi:hypothetical protein
MCCFSKPAVVSNTNIFARPSKEGRQFLVYSMTVKAKEDLAMILPIPVPNGSKEDAVKFLNLEKYPEFFQELHAGFPEPLTLGSKSVPGNAPRGGDLAVVQVGSFIASFVPSQKDFARLDEQFRLPGSVWDKLPQYKDWGFAVFQLKKGEKKIHPMAFEFPRADAKTLFFPTVHIHDGEVTAKAKFDHTLYCQEADHTSTMDWRESDQLAKQFMKNVEKSLGIVDAEAHVMMQEMRGMLKNEDVILRA